MSAKAATKLRSPLSRKPAAPIPRWAACHAWVAHRGRKTPRRQPLVARSRGGNLSSPGPRDASPAIGGFLPYRGDRSGPILSRAAEGKEEVRWRRLQVVRVTTGLSPPARACSCQESGILVEGSDRNERSSSGSRAPRARGRPCRGPLARPGSRVRASSPPVSRSPRSHTAGRSPGSVADFTTDTETALVELIDEVLGALHGLALETLVVEDQPARTLTELSREADLVLVRSCGGEL